jgi:Fe-S-cluster containining protein
MNHPFSRSSCDCEKCTLACVHMPGTVAPGEPEKIAEHLGEPCDAAFLAKYFQASDGPIVGKSVGGEIHRYKIPTIVPKLTPTGCVFLSGGRCSIHTVAPFGCAMHKVCENEPDAEEKSTYVLNRIMQSHMDSGVYTMQLHQLALAGCIATPLAARKDAFARALLAPIMPAINSIRESLRGATER